jgi:hypothetical protein
MAWDYLDQDQEAEVFVGIPHLGRVSTAWAVNLLHTLSPYLDRIRLFTIHGHPIDVSRGILVQHALASKATHIYFLDSDVYTRPDTLERLMDHDLPIVSALYYRRHELEVADQVVSSFPGNIRARVEAKRQVGMPIFTPAMWKDFNYTDGSGRNLRSFRPILDGEFSPGQMLQVDAIPLGCCLIKTEVFKKIPPPWFYWTLGRDPSLMKDDPSFAIQFVKESFGCSEDLYFSLKARQQGYRLLCDTSTLVRHESQVIVDGEGRVSSLEV